MPPAEFIAFAEETGAVVEIGAIVLERVVEEAAKLRIPIHANVCAPELVDPGFLDRLDALVDIHQVPPELLVFELTERAFVGDDPVPLAVLEALHERGMGVAVDDFGTGYSSLAYLSRLPVDTMKIPKQFIDEVTGSREHHALARAVIELGAALDLKVIAEGIETPDQIAALRAFGCDYGQGFYYGMPADAELALRRVEAAARGSPSGPEGGIENMNGLTIRFRLRFAVAVTMAALLLLTLGTRASYAQTTATTNEYIVQMQAGYDARHDGRDIVAELGGQVTTPELPVINGFGAMIDRGGRRRAGRAPGSRPRSP